MVATKQLRLAVETEEERRARLEHLSENQHHRLSAETNEERGARLEHLSANHHLRLSAETDMSSLALEGKTRYGKTCLNAWIIYKAISQ